MAPQLVIFPVECLKTRKANKEITRNRTPQIIHQNGGKVRRGTTQEIPQSQLNPSTSFRPCHFAQSQLRGLGTPHFQEKTSRSEKAILGALESSRARILGAALGIQKRSLGTHMTDFHSLRGTRMGGLHLSWLILAFLGRPDFQSRGPKITILNGFGASGRKIGAHSRPSDSPMHTRSVT